MSFQYPSGARLPGTGPGVLETIIGGASKAVDSYIDYQDKSFKKEKEKVDTYVALRKAGYNSDEAAKIVQSGKFVKPSILGDSEYDLDMKKKRLDIEKTTEDISYTKAKKEALGKGGGYETADEIPSSQGGLPLKNVKQDKKTGMWYGEYGEKKSNVMDLLNDTEGSDASNVNLPSPKWTAPNWLSNIIGKVETPAMAKEQDVKKISTKTSPYSNKQEATIQANMRKYGKSRDEVIAALTKKGLL